MSSTLQTVYDRLFDAFGPQNWWPGDTPSRLWWGRCSFKTPPGRTSRRPSGTWPSRDLLDPVALNELAEEELQELVRPAGYYRVKTKRLRCLVRFVVERYDGDLDAMFATGLASLREELLSLNGIGPETADSILLYAGGLPTFVVDTYTHRILARHGWIGFDAGYYEIKDHFEGNLVEDVRLYNEFHALLVRAGHLYCRKRPKCAECPLADLLPEGGIREPDF